MSQGLAMSEVHPKGVTPVIIDPAARTTKRAYNALSASSVGLELGIAVIVGLLGGMWLDNRFGTTPWLMLVLLVLGLVAGFRNVLRAVERAERAGAAQDQEDKGSGRG
jgi:ATP synthase protein I